MKINLRNRKVIVEKNTYYDSVLLMQISSEASKVPGVEEAAVLMGTDLNKDILKELGLLTEEAKNAGPNDLIIAVVAENDESINKAIETIEQMLSKREVKARSEIRPKTLEAALEILPDANLVAISVPGAFAAQEALKALQKDLHVFMFSDNVPIEKELKLKQIAKEKGLLMMGADCGTAIINDVILGFGNVVNRGSIGIVASAGTGIQEVSTLVHKLGSGITHAIGTGGRDLSSEIGGIMTLEGLKLLENDKNTRVIVLISKKPNPEVLDKIINFAKNSKKPIVASLLGTSPSILEGSGIIYAATLEDVAKKAVALAEGKEIIESPFFASVDGIMEIAQKEFSRFSPGQKYIRGLFSGGTLCSEAINILSPLVGDVYSNIHPNPELKLEDPTTSKGHTLIDMGDDFFTKGRAHPMIDFELRKKRILKESEDPETAVISLDVVLGLGAHPDPASELVPAIKQAKEKCKSEGRYLSVIASITGTEKDPQNLEVQRKKLEEAGVIIMPSNAQAARLAALVVTRGKVLSKISGGE